ncbi:MAG: hypothetical protein ABH873_04170 [Candidatus Firestonebacteria bacterium]
MKEKNILVSRAISRANTGLYFLRECLSRIHKGGTDAAFSRSIYILFSFNFELILKSRIILNRSATNKRDLLKGIKHHNLEKLAEELPIQALKDIDIKDIKIKKDTGFIEYKIETVNGQEIIVQDLIDVRYDFIKDNLRNQDAKESMRMNSEIDILLEMVKKIMTLNS